MKGLVCQWKMFKVFAFFVQLYSVEQLQHMHVGLSQQLSGGMAIRSKRGSVGSLDGGRLFTDAMAWISQQKVSDTQHMGEATDTLPTFCAFFLITLGLVLAVFHAVNTIQCFDCVVRQPIASLFGYVGTSLSNQSIYAIFRINDFISLLCDHKKKSSFIN